MSTEEKDETGGGQSSNDLYLEAYSLMQKGICFEQTGNIEGAIRVYERTLELTERIEQRIYDEHEHSGLNLRNTAMKDHVSHRLNRGILSLFVQKIIFLQIEGIEKGGGSDQFCTNSGPELRKLRDQIHCCWNNQKKSQIYGIYC